MKFIRESPSRVGKREIARAFGITGAARAELNDMLRELAAAGRIERGRGSRIDAASDLPSVTVLEITEIDSDGEVLARPVDWRGESPPPKIYVMADRRGPAAPGIGQRVLARLRASGEGEYEARVMRHLPTAPARLVGIFRRSGHGGRIEAIDRRTRGDMAVAPGDEAGASPGDVVIAEPTAGRTGNLRRARVLERLGRLDQPHAVSMLAVYKADIPHVFPEPALAEAAAARAADVRGRADLRQVPLVTIDGADARDFDDAVHARPDEDEANKGGWCLLVAIADVAHYVRPASALDKCAHERGNSVYFPDLVIPMLPEALSNGLCSLRPGEDRACMVAHLRIDRDGRLIEHRFERGLMRSAARLTYEQAQAARDGHADKVTRSLIETVIEPLYGAYEALARARAARNALEIELPEWRVEVGEDGQVVRITAAARLDSHRLIEEFMIAANVAAAETLVRLRQPGLNRLHDPPDPANMEALRDFLKGIGYSLSKGQVIKPIRFNQILRQAAGRPEERLIHQLVLRSQSRAAYGPEDRGHFGLALRRYAHFTSPIRRYADLQVHRALIAGLRLESNGKPPEATVDLAELGEHLSKTERRAAEAERDAVDRHTAAFLSDRVGATFTGTVSGVTRAGLFVTLDETGADGIVPISSLPADYYVHDEARHRLVGEKSGRIYVLGSPVEVRLVEAAPVTGSLAFHLLGDDAPREKGRRPRVKRRAPARRRGRGRGRG